jgi:hypothetical protein
MATFSLEELLTSNASGSGWLYGTNTPDAALGDDGNFYLDTDSSLVYVKISGAWTTISSFISRINGLESSSQTLSVGVTGSDFGIDSAGNVHTFNLPSASSSNRGALTPSDWIAFNNKVESSALTTGLSGKQNSLVSGTNIRTVNGNSLLGSSDLVIAGGSSSYTSISTNTTLNSNTNYFAGVTGLIGTLPSSPAIGDFVGLSTGNYPLIALHGNASQTILNLSTSTTSGVDRGIYLRAYSSIQLIYVGSNLWISQYRSRTINNWSGSPILESTATQKAYTPSYFNNPRSDYGAPVSTINDNGALTSNYVADGILNGSPTQIVVTFPSGVDIQLTSYDLYVGQGNVGLAGTPNYVVTSVGLYGGNSLSTLIQSNSPFFANSNGVKQTFSVSTPNVYNQYVFSFAANSDLVGVLGLVLFGKQSVGGEILAS